MSTNSIRMILTNAMCGQILYWNEHFVVVQLPGRTHSGMAQTGMDFQKVYVNEYRASQLNRDEVVSYLSETPSGIV